MITTAKEYNVIFWKVNDLLSKAERLKSGYYLNQAEKYLNKLEDCNLSKAEDKKVVGRLSHLRDEYRQTERGIK